MRAFDLQKLTCPILIHDIDTKLQLVVLVQRKGLAFNILRTQSPSVQEGSIARLEVADKDLT